MEDGIESNRITIYDTIDSYERINIKKQLYVCIPDICIGNNDNNNIQWEKMLITDDYNKATEISRKKNYKIEIYKCGLDGVYQKS
jgi:hypothetical protein